MAVVPDSVPRQLAAATALGSEVEQLLAAYFGPVVELMIVASSTVAAIVLLMEMPPEVAFAMESVESVE